LQDNTRSLVPDQAAFRIDFAAFLRELTPRDRDLALFLSLGNSAKQAAAKFRLSPGRVTPLRVGWGQEWFARHGEQARSRSASGGPSRRSRAFSRPFGAVQDEGRESLPFLLGGQLQNRTVFPYRLQTKHPKIVLRFGT
jgi:hypothetical protein